MFMKDKIITDEELDQLLYEYMPKANRLLEQLEEERNRDMADHIFSEEYRRKIESMLK